MKTVATYALLGSLTLLLMLATSCTSCANHCKDSPQDCVTIPSSDATAPAVSLTAFSNGPQVTVTNTSAPATANIAKGDTITLWANCTDPDGGCKDVKIWVEKTTTVTNSDGTATTTGPGLLGNPSAEAADTTSKVGDVVPKQLIVTFKVEDFKAPAPNTSIRIRAWAEGLNFSNGKSTTKDLTLNFP